MPRSVATVINNNLSRGLITEATGLNFPENAVTDSLNTDYEVTGAAVRRKGIDLETSAETIAYSESDGVVREFIWQSVSATGGYTFLVLQIGYNIHFFELTENQSLSAGVQPASIDLRDYRVGGEGQTWIHKRAASFAAGLGYLFICHPGADPVVVRYNKDENVFEAARVYILIRDLEGVADGLDTAEKPVDLTNLHYYNLKNQGWFKSVRVGAADNEIGTEPQEIPFTPDLVWEDLV